MKEGTKISKMYASEIEKIHKNHKCEGLGKCLYCLEAWSNTLQKIIDSFKEERDTKSIFPLVTPEELHVWYLEATAKLKEGSFNPKAQKSYRELTEEQKSIDKYIAHQINLRFWRRGI